MSSVSSLHRGVVVPLSTPVTPRGDIDEAAVGRLVERLAVNGLSVFVLGTTGESASTTLAQRDTLVRVALAAAAGRVPVYAGIGDNCVPDTITAGRAYLEAGAAAVVAHLPCYYSLVEPEMDAFFRLLTREIDGPLMIYNIPPTTHMSIPLAVVERLADDPRIIGFKDSENTPGRHEEAARRFAGRDDFALFMGNASLSVAALRLGFHGLVPSSANLFPVAWRDLYRAALAGEWDRAEALQTRLDVLARLLQRNRSLGQSLAALKAALAGAGICEPGMLPPLLPLPADEAATLQTEINALGLE